MILHLPISLAPGRTVNLGEEPFVFEIDGRPVSLTFADKLLVFKISQVVSTDEAARWIRRIWRGLQFSMIRCGLAFRVPAKLQTTNLADGWQDNPNQLRTFMGAPMDTGCDGIVDAARPYLAPEGATLWKLTTGQGSVTVGTGVGTFVAAVAAGALREHAPGSAIELETALELFASAELEQQSPRPRLLTYVMAIEALAQPPRPKHAAVVEILKRLRTELDETLGDPNLDRDAQSSIQALRNELDFRQVASMRATVFRCIDGLAATAGLASTEAAARRKRFDDIYGVRGALSHTGQTSVSELADAVADARALCSELLSQALEYGLPPTA